MKNTINYLKRFRKGKGIKLNDMAKIIGLSPSVLSRIETGEREPNLRIILAYHILLKIPIERLLKRHYPTITKDCLRNALEYKDNLMLGLSSPNISAQIITLDSVIDRLIEVDKLYDV